jgi:TPR repeat protein
MTEATSPGYLVQSSKSALRKANPASMAARGLADLRGKGTAESIFRRAMMFRHDSTTGRKHRDECIRLLQQTLALEPGHVAARTLLGIAYSARRCAEQDQVAAVQLFQEAADQGYAHAQLCLAFSFLNGDGVPQNILTAVDWFRKSSENGLGVAQYELGCLLYDPNFKLGQNDYGKKIGPAKANLREAAKWYERAEAQGEEWAAYRLAHMYRNVSPRSPKKAELWERKGNELRHGDDLRSHSRRNAGGVFSRMLGGGVCPSIDKSTEIEARISMAAEQGDPEALIAIGHLYERGECTSTAAEWYDRAAKRGNGDALVKLAWFYFDGRGVLRDRAHAFELFRCAADQGDFRAQLQLAWMYENGIGVDCNQKIGRELTRKTEETTNTDKLRELAFMYSRGNGVERSEKKAVQLYRKAAELGDSFAQYILGNSYEQGEGLAKNYKMAASWYRKAAEQNESSAQYSLAILYLDGKGVTKDIDEAVRWCKKSAEQNDADALFLLAQLHESGTGVPQDLREAMSLYSKLQGDDVVALTYGMSKAAEEALERLRNIVENGVDSRR